MEKYRCKLCLKRFANGRALGGHMRSHMLNLYVPPKTEQPSDQLTESASSFSFSSSSSEEEEEEEEENDQEKELGYGLRENPKKSIRWVDPHFSYGGGVDAGSVVLQDGESETESSKNPIQRRSKRTRKSGITEHNHFHDNKLRNPEAKRIKSAKLGTIEPSWAEQEPVSSISDTTPEEDVAYCLMMLSRDKWDEPGKQEIDDQTDHQTEADLKRHNNKARIRGKYKCETCDKVFKSYQALGGHRASHKKIKLNNHNNSISIQEPPSSSSKFQTRNAGSSTMVEEKIHECPVCYRVFSSGQALGGHKRSHVTSSSSVAASPPPPPAKPLAKFGENLIDLNLPAPIDDDSVSQVEFSAVSDAEIFNPIKQ